MAASADGVWIAGDSLGRSVWHLDPRTEKLVGTVHLSFVPKGIAAGAGGVWVTSLLGDTVSRIDPASHRITATIPVGRGSDGVAARGGAVWVANVIDGTVSLVDAAGRRSRRRSTSAGPPSASRPGPTGCGRSCADEPPAPHLARSRGRGHPGARRRGALGRAVTGARQPAIRIGLLADCKGNWSFTYDLAIGGAELALIERGATRRAGRRLRA